MMQKYVSSKLSIYLIFCIVLQIAVPQFLKGQIRTDDKEISVSCGNYSFTDRICIGLIFSAIGTNTFLVIKIMEPFWFMAAIVLSLPRLLEKDKL